MEEDLRLLVLCAIARGSTKDFEIVLAITTMLSPALLPERVLIAAGVEQLIKAGDEASANYLLQFGTYRCGENGMTGAKYELENSPRFAHRNLTIGEKIISELRYQAYLTKWKYSDEL